MFLHLIKKIPCEEKCLCGLMKCPCVFIPLKYVNLDSVNSRLKYELGYANSRLKKRIKKDSRLRNYGKISRPRDYIYKSQPINCGILLES